MNKTKVVLHLVGLIKLRFRGLSESEIERELVEEGWAVGAIREAMEATG